MASAVREGQCRYIAGRPAIRKVVAHKIAQCQRDASQFPSRAKYLTI
jgi:hypothetical protein